MTPNGLFYFFLNTRTCVCDADKRTTWHDSTTRTAQAPQCFISIQMLLLSSLQLNCFDREIPHKFGMNKLARDFAVNIW